MDDLVINQEWSNHLHMHALVFAGNDDESHRQGQKEDINRKVTFLRQCPNYPPPTPLTPIQVTWTSFSEVKIQDVKVN